MKRNWSIIIILIGLILSYEFFVLGPYNRKYAPQKVEQTQVAQNTGSVAATPGTVVPTNIPGTKKTFSQ
jgi:hypothetical protein